MLKRENWRKNSLTHQEKRSEWSSPCCTVSEFPFFFNEMWFFDRWSTREIIRVPRKAFRAIKLLAYPRGLSLSRIYPTLWQTVASSCVCTSPMAVTTIVGLHDFVKVSISSEFKSFLLIMCIDAPESTTNSRSSGSRFESKQTPILRRWEECGFVFLL